MDTLAGRPGVCMEEMGTGGLGLEVVVVVVVVVVVARFLFAFLAGGSSTLSSDSINMVKGGCKEEW
jgi:hypothetical protein